MADAIVELLVTEAAIDKLGARGVSTEDARQIPHNPTSSSAIHVKNRRASAGC